MSAPLYAMKVLNKHGTTLRVRVMSVCEAGCLTYSRLFALNILYEPLWNIVYERVGILWGRPVEGPLRAMFDQAALIDWSSSGVPWAAEPRVEAVVRDVAYEDLSDDAQSATLRIEVTHPRWIAHVEPGMLWDSYVWDEHAPVVSLPGRSRFAS